MQLLNQKYLLLPVAFLGFLFVVDKIFLIPGVRANFLQPGGMTYYEQREEQVRTLKKALRDKKEGETIAVVMGDSRSFALGNAVTNYLKRSDIRILNFAGPQAMPVYHAYMAEKLFTGLRRPDVLVLGISLDAFNRNSGLLASPNLRWGVSPGFARMHRGHIPSSDWKAHMDDRRFALMGLGFSFKYLMGRIVNEFSQEHNEAVTQELMMLSSMYKGALPPDKMKTIGSLMAGIEKSDLSDYSMKTSPHRQLLNLLDGAQYAWIGSMTRQELKDETERLAAIYLKHYEVSEDQFYFYEKVLDRARRAGVRTIVFIPQANPYMQEKYEQNEMIVGVRHRVLETAEKYGATALDINTIPEAMCDRFYDASHLSILCFPAIGKTLLPYMN